MDISIETEALRIFLYGILSCKCPITEPTEKRLFQVLNRLNGSGFTDFLPVLSIARENPERTPVENLLDMCLCSRDNPMQFTITQNDVLRYLGSVIHYNMVVSNHPGIEDLNPGLLVSHLLIPVLIQEQTNGFSAVYENGENRITFSPVLIPEKIQPVRHCCGMHMGVVLCSLTEAQADMLHLHQEMIQGFPRAAGRVTAVDFRNLEPLGDHTTQVIQRFRRNKESCR